MQPVLWDLGWNYLTETFSVFVCNRSSEDTRWDYLQPQLNLLHPQVCCLSYCIGGPVGKVWKVAVKCVCKSVGKSPEVFSPNCQQWKLGITSKQTLVFIYNTNFLYLRMCSCVTYVSKSQKKERQRERERKAKKSKHDLKYIFNSLSRNQGECGGLKVDE